MPEKRDFFISYVPEDRLWAEWITWQLEAVGYTTIFPDWDFQAGGNVVLDIHRATIQATRTIALISPAYLASSLASAEWATAFYRDPGGEQGLLLPVQVQVSDVEGLLGPIAYIDLVDLDEAEAKQLLLKYVPYERRKPAQSPSFPGKRPFFPGTSERVVPVWSVPEARNDFFVGRKDILASLAREFRTSESKIQGLSGIGGIGKTQIALKYAYQNRSKQKYSAIFWLSADTHETLQRDAYTIAQILHLLPEEPDPAEGTDPALLPERTPFRRTWSRREKTGAQAQPLQLVKRWLEKHTQWLLIIDNVEDSTQLQDLLPHPGHSKGHILLTTRQTVLKDVALIPVEKVTAEEGTQILLSRAFLSMNKQTERSRKDNREFARKLSEAMDGLPLALDQAGAYMQETQKSAQEYLELYNDQAQRTQRGLLSKQSEKLLSEEHPSVVATFQLSFDKIRSIDATTAQVLQLCAFLHPEGIPQAFLDKAVKALSTTANQLEQVEMTDVVLEPLLRYSLMRRNPENKTYIVHRVLQTVLLDHILADQQYWLEKTISLLNATPIPLDHRKVQDNQRLPRGWLARLYVLHALTCAMHIKTWEVESAESVELLNRAGAYLYQQREYASAQQCYGEILRIKKPLADASNLDRARTLGILANLIYLQRQKKEYQRAVAMYQEALDIYDCKLSENDPYIGQLLQQYAMLLRRLKRWDKADVWAARERQIWTVMTAQEKKRSPWGWIGNLDWSLLHELEPGRYNLVGNLLTIWGGAYCALVGVPIAYAWLFHSTWWGWGTLGIMVLSFLVTLSDKIRADANQKGFGISLIALLPVSIPIGVAGWQAGNILLTLWQLTSWPVPLQFVFQGLSAFVCWAMAFQGLLALPGLANSMEAFPEYTLLPTFTFTFSLCGLPVLFGLLFHSGWVFVGVLLGVWLWATCHHLLIGAGRTNLYQKALASLAFAGTWGYLGWVLATSLGSQLPLHAWQQPLPYLLAATGFSLGFYCHFIAYRLLSGIGTEGSIILILEDLWVDFAVASLLRTVQTDPIKDWEDFYASQATGYRQQGRYAEAIACYTLILNVYTPAASVFYYVFRGNEYLQQHDYTRAMADFEQALSLDSQNASAWSGLGHVYLRQGDRAHAIEQFTRAIAYDPRNGAHYGSRGIAYFRQGNYTLALADFDRAIALDPKDALAYSLRGRTYVAQQNDALALDDLNKAIALNPEDVDAYHTRADLYARQNDNTHAIADFSRVIRLKPGDALAYIRRGQLYRQQKSYARAFEDFQQAIQLAPDDPLIYASRGYTYFAQEDYDNALNDFERYKALEPDNALTYFSCGEVHAALKNDARALAEYTQAIERDPAYVQAYLHRGNTFAAQKEYAQAIVDYSRATELNPTFAAAYSQRAGVYWEQHKRDLAFADLNKAIELDPTYLDAYFGRGHFYFEQHDYAHSIDDFARVIQLDPKLAVAYNKRGNAYYGKRDYERAIEDYTQAIALEPDVVFYNSRGMAYFEQKDAVHAMEDYDRAVALDAEYSYTYSSRGRIYEDRGDYARAMDDYDRAILLDARNAAAYNSRGTVHRKQGENAAAIADYTQAIALSPDEAICYSNRGVVYANQGNYARALVDLDRAIQLDPQHALTYVKRGDVYFNQGEYARTIEEYTRAIELDPGLAIAYQGRGNTYTALGESALARADYARAQAIEDEAKESEKAATLLEASEKTEPATTTEKTQNSADETASTFVRSEVVLDEKDVLTRVKRKDIPASWQIYTNESNPIYTIFVHGVIFLLPSGVLMGVVAGISTLFHLPWVSWVSGVALIAIILWGGMALLVVINTRRAKLVIMPEGFVYRESTTLSSYYGALSDLAVVGSSVTLKFNSGEERTAALSVSSEALQDLRKRYLQFKEQEPAVSVAPTFFIDRKAVLAKARRGDIPASWQIHRNKNAFLALATGGMLATLGTGIMLGIALAVVTLFHLHWTFWLWLVALALWWLLASAFSAGLRAIQLVIMPEGFVCDTDLSVHFKNLEEISIRGERVTLVFKNGKQKTVSLSVTETALHNLQNAYHAFKTQQLPTPYLNGCEVLARIKQKDAPPSWQVYRDQTVLITTLNGAHYSALLAAFCIGMVIFVAAILHLPWQTWTQWLVLGGLILCALITVGSGLYFTRGKLVVMPEGFVYREFLEKEPGLAFYYEALEEMSVQKKKVTFVFRNGKQTTVKCSVSEAALQHLQNTYRTFKALE
ncbi:MAG TPA: tetratricopeptide repeat protein [Ktedonobacteraceae bacterium]|nr:tetratricopeptide repeat protein [Ktedonobacteraceae bacterium]